VSAHGVAADGSAWLGLNYGRLARLRLVTGYPQALDWSKDEIAPEDDGVFIVDVKTGEKRLLVSYLQLDEQLRKRQPNLEHDGLFVNHTLWNRDSNLIYFFARAGWNRKGTRRINVPFSIRSDGTDLNLHEMHIGGHPEWAEGDLLIGRRGEKQILYDVTQKKVIEQCERTPEPLLTCLVFWGRVVSRTWYRRVDDGIKAGKGEDVGSAVAAV